VATAAETSKARAFRQWRAKQLRAHHRQEARRRIVELRREIQGAKNRAKAAQYEARQRCRAERVKLRKRIDEKRATERSVAPSSAAWAPAPSARSARR
jgi:hypothetical protein